VVRATRGTRPAKDLAVERAAIEGRRLEEWIDEGDLRAEASGAARRASAPAAATRRIRRDRGLSADARAAVNEQARDPRRADKLVERLAQAHAALDGERFDEARRIGVSLQRELPAVAAVHQVIGLASYRSGRWAQAITALEVAQTLSPTVELLPVLADAYRAKRRWADVDRIWLQVRELSPAQDVMAEARIVAAGAQADRGDLTAALHTMAPTATVPRRVRDHHLRQWYVLADLYDRAGDPVQAVKWFGAVAEHDADFVDVRTRLAALGR